MSIFVWNLAKILNTWHGFCLYSFITDYILLVCFQVWKKDGKIELKVVHGKLLDNARKWEVKEKSTTSKPRKPEVAFTTQEEANNGWSECQ